MNIPKTTTTTTAIEVEKSGEMAFKRSSKLIRSPDAASTSIPNLEKEYSSVYAGVSAQQTTPVVVDLTENKSTINNQVSVIKETALMVEISQFMKIMKHVKYLAKMCGDPKRRSVVQEMRDAAFEANKCMTYIYEFQGKTERSTSENCSQTSPLLKGALVKDSKRKQVSPAGSPQAKRTTRHPKNQEAPQGEVPSDNGEGSWVTVAGKKNAKKAKKERKAPKLKKARPDAIVVKSIGKASYADILRQVKSNPNLKEVGESISKIRRTQKGELLFQLTKTGTKSSIVSEKIKEVLGQEAEVKNMTSRTTIEIKNVDEITSKEEVVEKVKEQFDFDVPPTDIGLRKAYGETQIASVTLPSDMANKMLEVGKIKIGWSICHIREKPKTLTKCFRCLEFGHIARRCKSEEDRSKLCRRCGFEGHMAKDCENDPKCLLCSKDGKGELKHTTGGKDCPYLRKALKERS